MRRREFIAGLAGATAWPVALKAQQPARVYRLGFLRNGSPPQTFVEGLRQGMRELGYVEGQNIRIEYGLAASAAELPAAAAELVRLNVDLIIASGTPPTVAAKNATSTIPIVFVASIDPVAAGVVRSLAKPGANITGFAGIHADVMGKKLELLKELVPGVSRVAVMAHSRNPGNQEYLRQVELAAPPLGLKLQLVTVTPRNSNAHLGRWKAQARSSSSMTWSSPHTGAGSSNWPRRSGFRSCTASESSWMQVASSPTGRICRTSIDARPPIETRS